MKCPKCSKTKIANVKTVDVPWNETYRKKKCLSCGHKFYTAEFEVEPNKRFRKEWEIYGFKADPNHFH